MPVSVFQQFHMIEIHDMVENITKITEKIVPGFSNCQIDGEVQILLSLYAKE